MGAHRRREGQTDLREKMRGRKPKPTSIKLLQGNPGRRPVNKEEPQYRTIEEDCPEHLSLVARKEWDRMRDLLQSSRILTEADRSALAAYCVAWGRWVEAEENIKKTGILVKSPNGFPIQNPWLPVSNKAFDHMHKLLQEFGLTPASRSKVKAIPAKDNESGVKRLLG